MKNHVYFILALFCSLFINCAAPITMISSERQSMDHYKNLEIQELQNDVIGQINENITTSIMEQSIKGIVKLNRFEQVIVSDKIQINDADILAKISKSGEIQNDLPESAVFKVTLVEFDKGNAFLRFLFGNMAGTGKVTCEMVVQDKSTGKEVLKAQTTAQIAGSFASEDDVIGPISKALVKFIKEEFASKMDYVTINLTDDRKIYGQVLKLEKDVIHLADKNTLYHIRKNKILSIQDDGVEVTMEQLGQKEYGPINYNKYSKSITIK
jgi:hypothetical protein